MVVEAQEDISGKRFAVRRQPVSHAWCRCHDRIVCDAFIFLVYLVESMRYFVRWTAEESTRHIALLLIGGGSEVGTLRAGIAIVAKACDTFTRHIDSVEHDASTVTHGRRHHQ